MKKLLVLAALALAVPSLALAAKPPSPGDSQGPHGKSAPKVMYILKGTLSSFSDPGTVTIMITHANHHAKTLVNTQNPVSLTINVSAQTKVVFFDNGTTIGNGDKGMVKVRLPKNTPAASLTTALTTLPTVAFKVVDQSPAS